MLYCYIVYGINVYIGGFDKHIWAIFLHSVVSKIVATPSSSCCKKKKVIDYAPSLALSLHTASKAGWAQKQESLNDHKDPVSPTQKEISLLKFNANIVLNEFYPHE